MSMKKNRDEGLGPRGACACVRGVLWEFKWVAACCPAAKPPPRIHGRAKKQTTRYVIWDASAIVVFQELNSGETNQFPFFEISL